MEATIGKVAVDTRVYEGDISSSACIGISKLVLIFQIFLSISGIGI